MHTFDLYGEEVKENVQAAGPSGRKRERSASPKAPPAKRSTIEHTKRCELPCPGFRDVVYDRCYTFMEFWDKCTLELDNPFKHEHYLCSYPLLNAAICNGVNKIYWCYRAWCKFEETSGIPSMWRECNWVQPEWIDRIPDTLGDFKQCILDYPLYEGKIHSELEGVKESLYDMWRLDGVCMSLMKLNDEALETVTELTEVLYAEAEWAKTMRYKERLVACKLLASNPVKIQLQR